MTFKLVIFSALLAIAKAGYINGAHAVGPTIGGSFVSNGGLLRTGSQAYSSGYGYPLGSSRSYSSGLSGSLIVRPTGYGSPYPYGTGRNSGAIGVPSYQTISANYGGPRSLQSSYPSPTYSYSSSPGILKSSGTGFSSGFNGGFNGGYNNGYGSSNLQNFAHQPAIAYTVSPIPHNPHGNSFNALATGYGY